jgi:hypothetical protein
MKKILFLLVSLIAILTISCTKEQPLEPLEIIDAYYGYWGNTPDIDMSKALTESGTTIVVKFKYNTKVLCLDSLQVNDRIFWAYEQYPDSLTVNWYGDHLNLSQVTLFYTCEKGNMIKDIPMYQKY